MAWTADQIAALKRAIATGSRRVEYQSGDTKRVIEYHSLAEMRALLAEMEAGAAGASPARVSVVEHTRD